MTLILFLMYFLPAFIAVFRKHHNATSITIINVFLGFTVLGWIVALAWSASDVKKVAA